MKVKKKKRMVLVVLVVLVTCGTTLAGSAMQFDGVDDYVEISNYKGVSGGASRTFVAWIKTSNLSSNNQVIGWGLNITEGGLPGERWVIQTQYDGASVPGETVQNDGYIRLQIESGSVPCKQNVCDGVWHHIAVVQDGNSTADVKVYVDGIDDTDTANVLVYDINTNTVSPDSPNVKIGDYGGQFFDGLIDDVAIYNRALTDLEIEDIYHCGVIIDANLVGYWDFEEGSGQVSTDMSGNGNNGQLGSTPDVDSSDPVWVASEVPEVMYHVDGLSGSDSNSGLTKETAFATIQHAINTSHDCDTVLVWPGVYHETVTHGINFMGKAITVKGAPDADAPVLEVPGFTAVSFYLGEDENSVLSNFVIRGSSTGIFALFANPTIDHVTVVNNNNGVIADNASPVITNSIFWDNLNGDLYNCTAQNSFVEDEVGLDDGLVAYWTFDEGSGSTAYDSVGGNNGTLINGPTWAEGKIGGALSFDGIDDYVSYGDILDNDINDAFTIGVWIKMEEGFLDRSENGYLLWKEDDRPSISIRPDGRVAFAHWYTYQDGKPHVFQSAQVLEEEQWYYITYIFNGSKFTGYVNAEYAGTVADSGFSPGGSLWIATDNTTYRRFKGMIDDIRIYNRALSAEEIGALYEAGLAGYGSPDPLFADPNNGDYHLLSERGRYRPSTDEWILDDVTSPCVDAGNPNTAPTTERMPNGGRINMGAYGNTATASMSEWALKADFDRDGIVNLSDFAVFAENWLQKEEWKN